MDVMICKLTLTRKMEAWGSLDHYNEKDLNIHSLTISRVQK